MINNGYCLNFNVTKPGDFQLYTSKQASVVQRNKEKEKNEKKHGAVAFHSIFSTFTPE